METITIQQRVLDHICSELLCDQERICGKATTFEKKVVVFILYFFYNYKAADVAKAYGIYELYFDLHIKEIQNRYIFDGNFRNMIIRVLNKCDYAC